MRKIKQILTFILALCLCFGTAPINVMAADNSNCETVNYMVIPQYSGNAGKPSSIKLIAKGNKGFNLDVIIRNKIERTKI